MLKNIRYIIVSALACAALSVPAFAADNIIEGAETIVDDIGSAAEDLTDPEESDDEAVEEESATTSKPAQSNQENDGTGNPATGVTFGAAALGLTAAIAVAAKKRKS